MPYLLHGKTFTLRLSNEEWEAEIAHWRERQTEDERLPEDQRDHSHTALLAWLLSAERVEDNDT